MKRLYVVDVEWLRTGDIATPELSTVTVVASAADIASRAAVKFVKSGLLFELKYVRVEAISRGHEVDLIA